MYLYNSLQKLILYMQHPQWENDFFSLILKHTLPIINLLNLHLFNYEHMVKE